MATQHKGKRRPPTQWPFPRDITRRVTGPELEPGDTLEDCRRKWNEWLGVVSRLRQMDIPARSGGHKEG